ncbi:methylated-DNA--[protein]-cysteine S-methyltransferase [Spelaeicoccus albus]|nr:methylated-DNA--[protein]-cysteine S-methyltransferase [Spelaeicoccus albus]
MDAVRHRIIDTPVGALLLAATEAGIVRVAFERENFDVVLADLAAALGPTVARPTTHPAAAARQLGEYFAGRRTVFTVPVDYALSSGFRLLVLRYLPQVPYASTVSYGEVAGAVGHPRAARAVGSACRTNPLPILVPCHRVVHADGTPGGYLGGLEAKAALLALEQQA